MSTKFFSVTAVLAVAVVFQPATPKPTPLIESPMEMVGSAPEAATPDSLIATIPLDIKASMAKTARAARPVQSPK